MNKLYHDFNFDPGPESLPCHNLINNNNNNNNNSSFHSKYLYFNGLGATLPRKPKCVPSQLKTKTQVNVKNAAESVQLEAAESVQLKVGDCCQSLQREIKGPKITSYTWIKCDTVLNC